MRVLRMLRSPKFFYVVVSILVVQACWIALTARYPQAFDENYHFGLISLHTREWLPFFTYQPSDAAVYGAIVRDPSYLYQYMMSFPYMLLRALTDSVTTQIIVLRLINIGLFVASLFVYRKVFDELGISAALRNVVLLFFVLLPVVPLLAGQINYDNLMLLLNASLFLFVIRYVVWLRSPETKDARLPVANSLAILSIGMAGSLVKFPFAPIFFATFVILGFLTWRKLRKVPNKRRLDLPRRGVLIPLVLLTALLGVLIFERYGVNMIQYHAPVPKCDDVLSVETCQAYSPWARDHMFSQTLPRPTALGIAVYPWVWFHRMVYETQFTITSYYDEEWGMVTYKPYPPLTTANWTGWTIVMTSLFLIVVFWKRVMRDYALRVLLGIIAFYTFVLFVQNYQMYLHSGEAVAIHGRYLIPVFPIILLTFALGFSEFFRWLSPKLAKMNLPGNSIIYAKVGLLLLTLVLFLQGGGITNWLTRSDPSWYWQENAAAQEANAAVKSVLSKLVYPR